MWLWSQRTIPLLASLKQKQKQLEAVTLVLPIWMDTGNIFNIAVVSSTIISFLRYIENIRGEEEANDSHFADNSIHKEYHSEDEEKGLYQLIMFVIPS